MKAFHSIVLCVIFVLFGCGDKKDDGAMGAVPVQTSVIETQNVELEFEYPAKLKSVRSVDVYARVEMFMRGLRGFCLNRISQRVILSHKVRFFLP